MPSFFSHRYACWAVEATLLLFFGFVANCFAHAADSNQGQRPSEVPSIEFFVDDKAWEPPDDVKAAIRSAKPVDFSNTVIRVLFNKQSLQNIVVWKSTTDSGAKYEVRANRLPRVGEIGFRGLSASQMQQIRPFIRSRVGLPFVNEEVERDRDAIRNKLFERGYRLAEVGTPQATQSISGDLKLVFPVSLNTPCRIAEVRTEPDEGVFDYFTTPIELGSLCDRAAIEDILERQRTRLLSEGYLASEVNLLGMEVTDDAQRASVRLSLLRGPRTRIEIINRQTGNISDALTEFQEKISAYDVISLSDEELRADVRRMFVNRGFATTVVTGPTRVTESNGDAVVRFYVQTGPLVIVGDVNFIGELPIPKQQVLERLELLPTFFSGAVPYVEESLARYREKLAILYLEEGFADVRVGDPVTTFSLDGRSVKLTFDVKPGLRSVLRDVTILGRPADFNLTKNFQERILQPGQPVNAQKLKSLEDEVRIELMNSGYAYAQIDVNAKALQPAGEIKPIQVTVDINSGPLVRVGRIYAEGDSFGKQERIILESGIRSGDLFTPDALERGRSRILKHDLFDSVLIEPLSSDALARRDAVLDLVIRLSAKRSYSLGLSPSYGTRSGYRFNVDFAKNNLTADGLRFTSTLTLSQEKLQNSVLSNQRIMGRKLTVGLLEPLLRIGNLVTPLDWSAVSGIEVSAQALSDRYFETYETGFSWRPSFFSSSWTFQSKLVHEWSMAFGLDIKPLEALERPTVTIREYVLAAALDTRNSLEWPTRGVILDVHSNHARFGLSSNVQYDRYSVDTGWFFPIFKRLSGALNIGGLKISDVINAQAEALTAPGSRRATLAGRAIVRGFPEASSAVTPGPLLWLNYVPPVANPALICQPTLRPIGATNVLYLKSELRLRSPWLDDSLGFAGFIDSGAAFFTGSELSALQARLKGGEGGLDVGSVDQCALKSAQVIGDNPIKVLARDGLKEYYKNSYISTGLGLRYIISNFASINVDVGFPLQEPADRALGGACLSPADVTGTSESPQCVKRGSTSKLFGLFPVPGAYHLGIGANF
ncbi:MAG: hypothetical protein RLZZ488_160 [Pseudomonadota bacterium]